MSRVIKYLLLILIVPLIFFAIYRNISFDNSTYIGVIKDVISQRVNDNANEIILKQDLKIEIQNEKIVEVVSEGIESVAPVYEVGDKVLVKESENQYYVTDYVRLGGIFVLCVFFILLAVFVAGKYGVYSILSMFISFVVIFSYIIPSILKGNDPVITILISLLFIIPTTFYFSHGFNIKTTIAIVGTLLSVFLTGLLARYFIDLANLNGFQSEEAYFLNLGTDFKINLQGLLFAGIIVSLLGVLDDVTVSQVNIVLQLDELKKSLNFKELFLRSISVGKDHISSMINTLVLVFTGTSFPLLIAFYTSKLSIFEIINQEFIATEIINTLLGSIGLMMAIPIVTVIAVWWCKRPNLA